MEQEKEPFVIVWNQENTEGYCMLPRGYSVLRVWAYTESEAVEKASIKIMLTLQRELDSVECKVQNPGSGFEVTVTSDISKKQIARIFDIHALSTI